MPVTVTNVAQVHTVLTRLASSIKNRGFIAEEIFPVIRVDAERFAFFKFPEIGMKRYATDRAVGSAFQRIDYRMTVAYGECKEYGLEHAIDDRIRREAQVLEPDAFATEMLVQGLRLDQEKRVANLVTNHTLYPSDLTSIPATKWSSKTCTLHADITAAMEAVRKYIGQYPNLWLIPATVAQYISQCNDITDYVKNVVGLAALEKAKPESGYLLPPTIWGLRVVIAGAVENTANLQQAKAIRDVWGDYSILAYVPDKPTKFAPAFGYIFRRSGSDISVEKYRDESTSSDVIRARMIQTERFVCTDDDNKPIAGYLFRDVLA